MKPLPIITAVAMALIITMAPLASAAGAITFTSPAAGSSFTNGTSYTIAGTISNPGSGISVFLSVKNPNGVTVDAASVITDPSTGAFSYPTAAGGTSNWITGTYSITGTATNGDTGAISFYYTAPASVSFNETAALLTIEHQNQEILGNLSKISSSISALSGAITTLSTTVGNIQSAVSSLTATVGNIQTSISSIPSGSTLAATQTYVLVVAVLAAITLVLELAILVRKLS